jgi:single-stranded-DNA-specific exonuclease
MRWLLKSPDSAIVTRLISEADLSPTIAGLLATRGIGTAEDASRFLSPSLAHLHSPYLMLGMRTAVERLRAAIERKEQILIYGDYDVDGTIAVVILKTVIELCGGQADFHVPHRIREGYGMKDDVIERAAAAGVRLIISVDTGIRAFAAAETARRLSVDLIVTDHHLPEGSGVPSAVAVLNPNQEGCDYPCKALCGAGVAFKLAQAMLEESSRARLLPSFLKIVAIATIADAVSLSGENRVFAKLGLEGLRSPVNAGLKVLLETAELASSQRRLSGTDVAFRIAPRLNAAGRMDVARDVIELFTVRDATRARELAEKLDQLNSDRQREEQRIVEEIQQRLDGDAAQLEPYCLVLDGEGWHRGVIGIVATRVVERYGKPALVISCENGEAHGSGRSISSFHLLNALEDNSCRPFFTRFGGHAHAVGFSLPVEKIPGLRAAVDAYARGHLSPADFEPSLEVDAEIALDQITFELFDAIEQLEPFGNGNREPIFCTANARLLTPPRLLKEKHAKIRVARTPADTFHGFDLMGGRMAERLTAQNLLAGDCADIAFSIDENSHPDFGGLQLVLKDLRKQSVAAAV